MSVPADPGVLLMGPVLTMDPGRPRAGAILVRGTRVVAVGDAGDVEALAGPSTRREVLPPGACLVPGFVDPHVHLLAAAAALLSVDVQPPAAPDVPALCRLIARAVEQVPRGTWVRATGYEDSQLDERRHPSRAELDAVAAEHPVVVHHATGHAAVLNTAALRAVGADVAAHDDGLLVDAHEILGRVPRLTASDLVAALAAVSRELVAHGVTAVGDATFTNGPDDFRFLARCAEGGRLHQRLSVMPGARSIRAFLDDGLGFGSGDDHLRIGPVKVMANEDDHLDEVPAEIELAHAAGFPVAAHVVDLAPLEVVLGALETCPPPLGTFDRLEHVSLSLPEHAARVAALGAAVVTHPSFLVRRRARYDERLTEVERGWLFRVASFLHAGVPVAFSSDLPVVPARPLEAVATAIAREPRSERVDHLTALALVTREAARVGRLAGGALRPGAPADLVQLGANPVDAEAHDVSDITVEATWIAGRPAFRCSL